MCEEKGDIRESIPITGVQGDGKHNNVIFSSMQPVVPALIVRDMPLYYAPREICLFVQSAKANVVRTMLFTSSVSPHFILLLKLTSVEEADTALHWLRENENPIPSRDILRTEFMHSFECETTEVDRSLRNFLAGEGSDDCVICLEACHSNPERLLFTLPCGHTIHMKCAGRMARWVCPVCRYAPLSAMTGIGVPSCDSCGDPHNPMFCLGCMKPFCNDHCTQHYRETGHAYCSSADGRETWNLMSDCLLGRVALEKNGELVEMCGKDDNFGSYLEHSIQEQLEMHALAAKRALSAARNEADQGKDELRKRLAAIQERIKEKRQVIEMGKRKVVISNLIETRRREVIDYSERIAVLRQEIAKLKSEVKEVRDVASDMHGCMELQIAARSSGGCATFDYVVNNRRKS